MKSNLLGVTHIDYTFSLSEAMKTTCDDLELYHIINVMAKGDEYISDIIPVILFQPSTCLAALHQRQLSVKEALKHRDTIRLLYDVSSRAVKKNGNTLWRNYDTSASFAADLAVSDISYYLDELEYIKTHTSRSFSAPAFKEFFHRLDETLSPENLKKMREILSNLKFEYGEYASASLDTYGRSKPCRLLYRETPVISRFLSKLRLPLMSKYTFEIPERDEAMARDLRDFKNMLEYDIAEILSSAATSTLNFFKDMKAETAFLTGAINLYEALNTCVSYPVFGDCLEIEDIFYLPFLLNGLPHTANSLSCKTDFLMITGANQGGKTTFLKLLGETVLLAQAGLPIPCQSITLPVYASCYTHFRQEEDSGLTKGKLAEEMARFSSIIPELSPSSLVLFNESFASTNESEGSIICEEVSLGLLKSGISIFFVTHLYEFAASVYDQNLTYNISPGRNDDGSRNYKFEKSKPIPTSYGMDLYESIYHTKI